MDKQNIYQKLLEVQKNAKAPRSISGKFGKGRSAEQVLEAYKPICNEHGLYLYTSDIVKQVGDRNYIETTATVVNVDNPTETHSATAGAWENKVEMSKGGSAILDTSQVTGKTSSYAKKYALQNLFAIDDTKDADNEPPVAKPKIDKEAIKTEKAKKLRRVMADLNVVDEDDKLDFFQDALGKNSVETINDIDKAIEFAETKLKDLDDASREGAKQ